MHPTTDASAAVWSLALPEVERLLCHAESPPAGMVELARRGLHVDVVTRCAHEAWPDVPRLRALWEPDPDVAYDAAVLWDPRQTSDVRAWIDRVRALDPPPVHVAVRSRGGIIRWLAVDVALKAAGFRLEEPQLALPDADRVRQLLGWDAWCHTPHIRHRRSHRAWKARLTRTALWRWLQPVRLRRATLVGRTAAASVLDAVVAAAGRTTGARCTIDRCLVSPNGVSIASVRLASGDASRNAILKIPYALASSGRVARNAAGLEWFESQAHRLGPWAGSAPRLLGRGAAGAWSFTLEERVEGGEAQAWSDDAARDAMRHLTDLLQRFAALGGPAAPLDAQTLDSATVLATTRIAALLETDSARRLQAIGSRLQAALAPVAIPLVPRHGDFKLENVLGRPFDRESFRVLDWELWSASGLPLLDAWHLVVSRRARRASAALGAALRETLESPPLEVDETSVLESLGATLDPRYVALAPVLYWLDRIGPVAARGCWPSATWPSANVTPMLDVAERILAAALITPAAGAVCEVWGGGR